MLEHIPEMQGIFQGSPIRFDQHLPHTDYLAYFLEIRHKQTSIPYLFVHDEHDRPQSLFESFCTYNQNYEKPEKFHAEGGGILQIMNYKITIFNSENFKKYHEETIIPIMRRFFARHLPGSQIAFEQEYLKTNSSS